MDYSRIEKINTADKASHIEAIKFWEGFKKRHAGDKAKCQTADKHIANTIKQMEEQFGWTKRIRLDGKQIKFKVKGGVK